MIFINYAANVEWKTDGDRKGIGKGWKSNSFHVTMSMTWIKYHAQLNNLWFFFFFLLCSIEKWIDISLNISSYKLSTDIRYFLNDSWRVRQLEVQEIHSIVKWTRIERVSLFNLHFNRSSFKVFFPSSNWLLMKWNW